MTEPAPDQTPADVELPVDPPSANAPMVAAVVCPNPACDRRGQHHAVHADTVQPVHCGGCGTVLHCDHRPETTRQRAGTIGAPVEHEITACTVCRAELKRTTRELDPAEVLRSLPLAVLDLQL